MEGQENRPQPSDNTEPVRPLARRCVIMRMETGPDGIKYWEDPVAMAIATTRRAEKLPGLKNVSYLPKTIVLPSNGPQRG